MRILTYKRTHTGDPDHLGRFGINDCMGRVRNWRFDAVIGVGGFGSEPIRNGIEGRITWVGRKPTRQPHPEGFGQIVTFESFVLLDTDGPLLQDVAPLLARRMYEKKARVIFNAYSTFEKQEAEAILENILGQKSETPLSIIATRGCYSKRITRKMCRVVA